tara:strand:+ start:397 stop:588 length:192 start_codon:yes stop_codon:yes gene_type:complete
MDDESERFMLQLDDPCDHITDTTGWTRYEHKEERSGTGKILRVDAMEDAPSGSFIGLGQKNSK